MNTSDVKFPTKFSPLFQKYRYKIAKGGRGGAKSWAFARALLILAAQKPLRILCAREFQTSIKDSVHKLLCDQIIDMGLIGFYEITQASLRGRNGTEFFFAGLRNNISSIKSFEGIDICWIEEAQTVSKSSWDTLIPTIRKDGSEIWISFNPDLESDETYQRFIVNQVPDSVVINVNWNDNPWFPEVLQKEMESLKRRDFRAYQNVWEGLCKQTVDGAVFADQIDAAEQEGRITKVLYDPTKPVHAVCDLGWSDATAWWLIQFIGMETRFIRYFEDSQKTMTHYLAELQKFGYVYDTIWLPHDAQNKTLAASGRTIEDIVRSSGYKTRILDKVPVVDSINAARTIFSNCWFDRENCADGLNCLRHYRYEVDPDTKQFSKTPLHDQYSHGADAFRYIGLMLSPPKKIKKQVSSEHNISWMA